MSQDDDLPRDEHLRHALRHAPDGERRAPALLSAAILAAARREAAQAPGRRRFGLQGLRGLLGARGLPWQGAGTLAAVLLVSGVLWVQRDALPPAVRSGEPAGMPNEPSIGSTAASPPAALHDRGDATPSSGPAQATGRAAPAEAWPAVPGQTAASPRADRPPREAAVAPAAGSEDRREDGSDGRRQAETATSGPTQADSTDSRAAAAATVIAPTAEAEAEEAKAATAAPPAEEAAKTRLAARPPGPARPFIIDSAGQTQAPALSSPRPSPPAPPPASAGQAATAMAPALGLPAAPSSPAASPAVSEAESQAVSTAFDSYDAWSPTTPRAQPRPWPGGWLQALGAATAGWSAAGPEHIAEAGLRELVLFRQGQPQGRLRLGRQHVLWCAAGRACQVAAADPAALATLRDSLPPD